MLTLNEIKVSVKVLPHSAAPYLTFEFEKITPITSIYKQLSPQLEVFVYIGFDGEGSPICVNQRNNSVYILDHEFDFLPVYMNASIQDLERFLNIYQKYIEFVNEKYGDDAFFEGRYPESEIDNLKTKLSIIDLNATLESSFWGNTLEEDRGMLNG